MEPNLTSSALTTGVKSKSQCVLLNHKLQKLISSVKNIQFITTLDQVLDGLKMYITSKQLFDPHNPARIFCKNDALESVFGVPEFTVFEVRNILQKLVFPVSYHDSDTCPTNSENISTAKRKAEEEQEEKNKKFHFSPMILCIPSTPSYTSKSDSPESVQGYETEFVKDPSDSWSTTSDDDSHSQILAIEETFDVEYEVEDLESSDSFLDSGTDSDEEAVLNTAAILLICRTDSDMEFWADNSSSEDEEISESDLWQCDKCGLLNKPLLRWCLKCCNQRQGWLAEDRIPPKLKRKKRKPDIFIGTKDKLEDVADCPSNTSRDMAIEVSNCNGSNEEVSKMCILCYSKPANASIIHGKFAHQMSCYECAKKLQRKKGRCPICRRTIDKVVYQISAV